MNTATNTEVHRWRGFAVLAVSYFMTIVDLTIVNVALPTIGRELHFSESNLQWVVTAYGLTFGGFLLLGGRAADLLGRRRILVLGLAVFRAASSPATSVGSTSSSSTCRSESLHYCSLRASSRRAGSRACAAGTTRSAQSRSPAGCCRSSTRSRRRPRAAGGRRARGPRSPSPPPPLSPSFSSRRAAT